MPSIPSHWLCCCQIIYERCASDVYWPSGNKHFSPRRVPMCYKGLKWSEKGKQTKKEANNHHQHIYRRLQWKILSYMLKIYCGLKVNLLARSSMWTRPAGIGDTSMELRRSAAGCILGFCVEIRTSDFQVSSSKLPLSCSWPLSLLSYEDRTIFFLKAFCSRLQAMGVLNNY